MFVSGDDISKLRIGLASPDEMRKWSKGEVTESETINYRTHRPERGGLFAEEIFGPENDFECGCGKYRGRKYEGIKCEKCGVLVTDKSVRRVNMGHIDLASPVVHFWYLKGVSSPLSTLLGLKRVTLKRIAYYETESRQEELFIVTESADDDTMLGEILSKTQLSILQLKKKFKAEPAFLVEPGPAVLAEVAGKVGVVPMRLENGEEITMVRVDDKEYPLSSQADVLVRSGETVKAGAVLAESPCGRSEQLISEFKFNALRQFYPQIKGAKAVDTVDNLLYLVTEVRGADFPKQVGDLLLEDERYAYERIYRGQFEAHTGALGIQGVLANLDLNRLSKQLKSEINAEPSEGKRKRLLKRLEIVEHLRNSGNRPQDMVMEVIPVMPPNLRPIVQLEGGKFATTDLNDLYRRIINRNNRLKKLKEMGAPEVILRNERRMLQEAVDALIYNEKKENPILGRDNRPLKSLSERISGKQGRLRRNLLGKRVDYSGRAVIVVNPKLKLHQCGLPKKMALELFRPFIHQQLQLLEKQVPITNYDELKNKALAGEMPEVWDVLDRVIKDHPVLLNRAPTLHRLGIQAFEPVLVDGEAIQIHPFVCAPYNADFDGDTMSVHVPLYPAAIREARELMLSAKNILSPASGEPLSMPTQDFIFVVYYLTAPPQERKGSKRLLAFANELEAQRAYEEGHIALQSLIEIRVDGKLLKTTLGRVLFNRILPQDLRDFDRVFDSSAVRNVIMACYHTYGNDRVVQLLEDLKELGLEYGVRSGLTISVRDCLIPAQKPAILAAARSRVGDINEKFEEGLSTDAERKEAVIKVWRETVDQLEDHTMENFAARRYNPIFAIVQSGARGSSNQVKQLAGMRGPMTDPSGETLEMPVISNFREGLTTMEFFISTHGGRKGTADTALKTADSGYLTRRLVDACEELVVTQEDCGTGNGIELDPLYFAKGQVMEDLETRLYGRYLAADVRFDGQVVGQRNALIDGAAAKQLGELKLELKVKDPKFSQRALGTKCVEDVRVSVGRGKGKIEKVIMARDEVITSHLVEQLKKHKVDAISVRPVLTVRSALTCEAEQGICQRCYGLDLSCHRPVALGTAVGVIAAESIGEPGTQLTMRTFHTGGVAGEDITQGLPRAEELFEARKALRSAQGDIAPISGHVVSVEGLPDGREQIRLEGETQTLVLPRPLCQVQPGDQVHIEQFISAKSALGGRLDLIEMEGRRYLVVLEEDDAVVLLPAGATPIPKNGQSIKAKARLTSSYHIPPVEARHAGKVKEVSQDKKTGAYVVVVVGEDDQAHRYTLPGGAKPEVGAKEKVDVGTLLSTAVACEPLVAPRGGKVFFDAQRMLIINPDAEGKLLPLTEGVVPVKRVGERVSAGEPLLSVASAKYGALATVEEVEALDDETVAVRYRFETALTLINTPLVRVGDKVRQGDLISKGVISPHVLLKEAGVRATREYLLVEIHKVYKSQGVDINDKHIELVIRQMLNNVSIEDAGDSPFTPNQIVPLGEFGRVTQQLVDENQRIRLQKVTVLGASLAEDVVNLKGEVLAQKGQIIEQEALDQWIGQGVDEVVVQGVEGPAAVRVVEKRLPRGERILLRISKAALESKSWLSAASFQRTTMVLDQAAMKGAHDNLESLKANVIISSLIPAGTGFAARQGEGEEATADQPEAEAALA